MDFPRRCPRQSAVQPTIPKADYKARRRSKNVSAAIPKPPTTAIWNSWARSPKTRIKEPIPRMDRRTTCHCAYYGTDRATTGQGIKVIDASDPQHPVVSAHLTDTPAALNPHETVRPMPTLASSWPGKTLGRILRFMTFRRLPPPGPEGQHQRCQAAVFHLWARSPRTARRTTSPGPVLQRRRRPPVHRGPLTDPSNPKALPPWQFLGDGRPHSLNLNPDGFAPGRRRRDAGVRGAGPQLPLRRRPETGW